MFIVLFERSGGAIGDGDIDFCGTLLCFFQMLNADWKSVYRAGGIQAIACWLSAQMNIFGLAKFPLSRKSRNKQITIALIAQ